MTHEFEHVRARARHSRLGRLAAAARYAVIAATRSSRTAAAMQKAAGSFIATAPPARLRLVALALAVAVAAHLLLRSAMSETVVPALPTPLLVAAGVLAILVSWQAAPFTRAWQTSRVARLGRRALSAHDPD